MKKPALLILVPAAVFAAANSLSAQTISIMPLGDSITVGVDYTDNSLGGYRDPLYSDLISAGITPQFVGATNSSPTTLLTDTGNEFHNGYGSYHIQDIINNLNGDVPPPAGGDFNQGGYWFTGGNGTGRGPVAPNIVLLEVGTNDFLQEVDLANIDTRITTLVTSIHALSPNSIVLVAGCIPINNNPGFNAEILAYDQYIENTLVPSLTYTRYVDLYSAFTNPDGSTKSEYYGLDNIHPDSTGYPEMASVWATAIENVEDETPIPEPGVAPLTAAGLLGLLVAQRLRKRSSR